MKSYGQFCSVARTLDLLGERWTLLVVRELLAGSTQFNEIRRGIPRISRTMLSERLRELVDAGVITRSASATYTLTAAGTELAGTVTALGTWGQRWLPRTLPREEIDSAALLWDIHRRIRLDALPKEPIVVRVELTDKRTTVAFLLLRRSEVSLCTENPGFPEALRLRAPTRVLTAFWRGDVTLTDARASGLVLEGKREWVRAFPDWLERYAFADVASMRSGPDSVPTR